MNRRSTLLLCLLAIALLTACGGSSESTPAPVAAAPTDTPLPTATAAPTNTPAPEPTDTPELTATPTLAPLTASEQSYFGTLYSIRDKTEAGFYSFSQLADALDQLQPPAVLAATHSKLLEVLKTLNFTFEMYRLSALTYAMSWCNFNSYDYFFCTQREEQALSDMRTYGAQYDTTKERFQTLWREAQLAWDEYRIGHDAEPVPIATPFPLPPVVTPIAAATPATGVFGVEVVVLAVDDDAWKAIEAENRFNDEPASSGNKYVMVTIRVTNRSEEVIRVAPSDFSLYVDL